MTEMNVYLQYIMSEMCSRVGLKLKDIDVKEKGWYNKASWTEEEQDDFISWMVDFLYHNSHARKEILTINIKNRRLLKRAASMFVLSYGWKIKDE